MEAKEIFYPDGIVELSTSKKIEALTEMAIAFHNCFYSEKTSLIW